MQIFLKPFTAKRSRATAASENKCGIALALNTMPKFSIMPIQITTEEFKSKVTESNLLCLVKFKTSWSGACQIVAPFYKELSLTYRGAANFFIVDTEHDNSLAQRFGIMELPTILLFKNGTVVDHTTGLTSKQVLIEKIEQALSGNTNDLIN
jgi:thioredoxin-like negative regulator of GroEL